MSPGLSSGRLLLLSSRALRYSIALPSAPRYSLFVDRELLSASSATRSQRPSFGLSTLSQNPCRSSTSSAAAPEVNNPRSPLRASDLPDLSNYYSIFPQTVPLGPPPTGPFRIDLPSLRRKAEALSARINEAYKALQDPLLRAQYLLLHCYGVDVTSEDNSSHPADPATLMEVMEAQESLEAAESDDQISTLKNQNQERIKETLRSLDDAFSHDHADAARTECIRLRYWVSLKEALNSWSGKGSDVRLVH